jgi:hypothetical protein
MKTSSLGLRLDVSYIDVDGFGVCWGRNLGARSECRWCSQHLAKLATPLSTLPPDMLP